SAFYTQILHACLLNPMFPAEVIRYSYFSDLMLPRQLKSISIWKFFTKRHYPKLLLVLGLSFLCHTMAWSQTEIHKCKWVKPGLEPVFLDSLSVLPSSIHAPARPGDHEAISYDLSAGTISFSQDVSGDSIEVCYQTLPFSF